LRDLKDVMIRFPLQSMHKRPQSLRPKDVKRLRNKD